MFLSAIVIVLVICLYVIYTKTKKVPKVKINGKAVLITGCDTGFGHELAKRLDQLGFTVFAGCLSEKSTGAQDLRKTSSRRVHILKLDVTNSDDIERATETVRKICKGVGRIVNVTSVKGIIARPTISVYGITKFGAENFSDCLRLEMRKFGVKVSIVEPGNFGGLTGIVKDQNLKRLVDEMELMWDGADEEIREAYGREHLEEQRNGLYKAPENCALSLEPVLCALEDAIVSENPAIRYLVDGGRGLLDWHNWFGRLHYYLPTKWMDFIIDQAWKFGIR